MGVGNNDRCSLRIMEVELPLRSIKAFNCVIPNVLLIPKIRYHITALTLFQEPISGPSGRQRIVLPSEIWAPV